MVRVKALLTLKSHDEGRYLYERVGKIVSPEPFRVSANRKQPSSGIFIGADINPEEILRLTQEILHPDCYFPEL